MKKYFLGLLLFSISLLGYTKVNASEVVTKVDETVATVEKSTQEVNATVVYFTEKLEELAKSLKVPAEHVYKVLVKTQVIKGYTWLVINILFILIVIGLWIALIRDEKNQDEWWGVPIAATVLFFISLYFTLNIITAGIFNPEYGALKEIMSLF